MEPKQPTFIYKGMPFVEAVSPRSRVEAIETYADVRDDDIFVCTSPKAGTHWAADIAHKVMYGGDLEIAKQFKTEAYLEATPFRTDSDMGPIGYMPRTLEDLSALPSPRVIITHLHISMLPPLVLQGKAKVIYVLRDPRDMAVSFHPWLDYQLATRGVPISITWDEFLEDFNSGRIVFGAWYKHFKDCQDNKDRPNVLGLKFEDMKQDLPGTVATIAAFLGKSLTDDAIQRIAGSCTFESLKAQYPSTVLLRKGVCGDWKNRFTVAQSERMTEELRRVKETLGLAIDYE